MIVDLSKKIDYSLKIYDDISRQIQFADTKAGLIMAWHGATSFFILNTAISKVKDMTPELWLVLGIGLFFVLVSIIYSICTVIPKVKSFNNYRCMFWIMDITHDKETYIGSIERFKKNVSDENQVFNCISNSVIAVTNILKKKYEYVQSAFAGLMVGFIFEVIFMLMVIYK